LKKFELTESLGCRFQLEVHEQVSGLTYIIDNQNIKSVWYRRGYFFITNTTDQTNSIFDQETLNNISYFQEEQNYVIAKFIYNYLVEKALHINRIDDNSINKIEVLDFARSLGLKIPPSYIFTKKQELKFNGTLVNKSLNNPVSLTITNKKEHFYSMTELLTAQRQQFIPSQFPPAFFQKYIDKIFEIRTFFLDGEFYSMAIFSQNDEQTKIDFRNYNFSKPNRCLSYELPAAITRRLRNLFNKLNMNSGSVDLIYDNTGDYYFLEINPVGQYDMVSVPCNYFLHKKIAKYLSVYE
jgi:ATP-GRASP peptide maturase of grasp-with-spasm system